MGYASVWNQLVVVLCLNCGALYEAVGSSTPVEALALGGHHTAGSRRAAQPPAKHAAWQSDESNMLNSHLGCRKRTGCGHTPLRPADYLSSGGDGGRHARLLTWPTVGSAV